VLNNAGNAEPDHRAVDPTDTELASEWSTLAQSGFEVKTPLSRSSSLIIFNEVSRPWGPVSNTRPVIANISGDHSMPSVTASHSHAAARAPASASRRRDSLRRNRSCGGALFRRLVPFNDERGGLGQQLDGVDVLLPGLAGTVEVDCDGAQDFVQRD
jgi:hypothetical protein